MRKERNRKSNILIYVVAALLCATLFSMHLVGGLYARYQTKSSGSDTARVAQFKILFNDDRLAQFSSEMSVQLSPQSDPQPYSFTVTNASEVTVALKVTLELDGNLPLLYSYKIGNTAETAWEPLTPDAEGNVGFVDTMSANGSSDPIEYTIRVQWDPTQIDFAYAGGVASMRLNLRAEQID